MDLPNPDTTPTTAETVVTTTTQPTLTTPTTSAATTTTIVEIIETPTTSTTEAPDTSTGVGAPIPPGNLKCLAGTAENELLVEFDALPVADDVSKIRTYMQVGSEPVITNGEFTVGQLDTTRSGGTRWAAPVRSVPANTALKLYVTSFNQLGQESGWYSVDGMYVGPGAPCGTDASTTTLPVPTGTAGVAQGEGETGS